VSHANAFPQEINLNSSNLQVVHNAGTNKDVLNMSLNVTSEGESGSCDGEADDLLETGVDVAVSFLDCNSFAYFCYFYNFCPKPFHYDVSPYVEHDIGNTSYGTYFALNGPGSVSSKIVALSTPPNTCGTWNINLQATGLDLSSITSSPVALFLNDSDDSGPFCFDVNANIGTGIVKPHHGVHRARH
jgi:hypothetical protein